MARMTTSPISALSANKRGLTLVEMIVAMLVIVILATILVPTISKAQRQAKRTRIAADIQVISGALNEYKNTCGTFPPVEANDTGAATLGKALMGPGNTATPPAPADPVHFKAGDCVINGTNAYVALRNEPGTSYMTPNWAPFDSTDGADGPGFKLRVGGRTLPPFLQPEAFKMHGCDIYDIGGHPILYFPANPGKPNIRLAASGLIAETTTALFNADNNLVAFRQGAETDNINALKRLQIMLGDTNCNGVVDTTETPIKVTDFLLYSAGLDNVDADDNGRYGPNYVPVNANVAENQSQAESCDDVTNAP